MEGRQPSLGLLGKDLRVTRSAVLLLMAALALTGCSGNDEPDTTASPSATPTPIAAPSTASPPTAPPAPPSPTRLECRRLTFEEALAPTDSGRVVGCQSTHTSQTYAVGRLKTVIDGHLVAVDSTRVQAQVARACPRKLAAFLGTTDDSLRLTMLRAVWFTPSMEESDAGADWFRCDVVAVAADAKLARLAGTLEGVLEDQPRGGPYAMCGTAAPDSPSFRRVLCREAHAWRAVEVVELSAKGYPGVAQVRAAGQAQCEDAGRAIADDALDYEWGYEWPTAELWAAGQRYGRCWAPDTESSGA